MPKHPDHDHGPAICAAILVMLPLIVGLAFFALSVASALRHGFGL